MQAAYQRITSASTSSQSVHHAQGAAHSQSARLSASLSFSLQPTNLSLRRQVVCHSSKDDKNDDKAKKADFSAYWSLKVREFFSSRKSYLEGASKKQDERPEALKQLHQKIEQQYEEVQQLKKSARRAGHTEEKHLKELDTLVDKVFEPVDKAVFGKAMPLQPPDDATLTLERAKEQLAPKNVPGIAIPLYRAHQMLQAVLMAPVTMAAAAYKAWQDMFNTQRYEMFLMGEGERIWYWRNRTENERWFWEIFAWDRLLFPILCTVAYEYIVPNNLIWAAVVPAMFLLWQNGRLPGPYQLEFWLIAYFGVYKKCWGDILVMAAAMFAWF